MVSVAPSRVTSAQGNCETMKVFSSPAAFSSAPPMVKLVEISTLAAARFSACDEAEACWSDSWASAEVSSPSLGQPVRVRVSGSAASRHKARFMAVAIAVDMPGQYGGKLAAFSSGTTTAHERPFAGREPEFSLRRPPRCAGHWALEPFKLLASGPKAEDNWLAERISFSFSKGGAACNTSKRWDPRAPLRRAASAHRESPGPSGRAQRWSSSDSPPPHFY